jgi:hypothetical protein
MADTFAMARFKARLLPTSPQGPKPPRKRTPEEREALLMGAVSMDEIHRAAEMLGLSFKEAYRARARLYRERWGI